MHTIVTLPGDGIGPEIVAATVRVLDAVGDFAYEEHLVGGCSPCARASASSPTCDPCGPSRRWRTRAR